MAEAIARRAVAELGWRGFQVRSAGTGAFDGDRISGGALRAAAGHGIDLSSHAATRFMHELGEWADLVLVMSPSHLMRIAQLGGGQNAALITAFGEHLCERYGDEAVAEWKFEVWNEPILGGRLRQFGHHSAQDGASDN